MAFGGDFILTASMQVYLTKNKFIFDTAWKGTSKDVSHLVGNIAMMQDKLDVSNRAGADGMKKHGTRAR